VHYLAPPAEGPVEVSTTIEREGRSLTFVSARLSQGGRLMITALAALARPLSGPEFSDLVMPEVGPPDAAPPLPPNVDAPPPMSERFDRRPIIGGAPMSGERSVSGGWLRLSEPRALDGPLVAALMDAWLPPLLVRATAPVGLPTIDLTVHFRGPLPPPGASPEDFYLGVFRTQLAAGGFVEEDGELWSADGVLLAHSRQLALVLPF
jgi:acyl-CoA thioesterase